MRLLYNLRPLCFVLTCFCFQYNLQGQELSVPKGDAVSLPKEREVNAVEAVAKQPQPTSATLLLPQNPPTLPSSFPTLKDTGNPERNVADLAEAKQKWAAQNPVEHQQELPADFPKYVDTGNPERDMADLAARKQAWVAANKAVYQSYQESQANNRNTLKAVDANSPQLHALETATIPQNREKAKLKYVKEEREEYKKISFLIPVEWTQNGFPSFETYPSIEDNVYQRVMWVHTHTDLFIVASKNYRISINKIVGDNEDLQRNLEELTQSFIEKARFIQNNPTAFDELQIKWAKELLTRLELN